jgi:hypothetical protein
VQSKRGHIIVKKKKSAVKKNAKPKLAAKPLRTEFMKAFIAQLITSKTNPWPNPSETKQSIVADFKTITDVLVTALLLLQPPVPDGSGSLYDRLAKFLIAQNWPTAPLKNPLLKIEGTVRLYEISVITDALLRAINAWRRKNGGGGGGGGQWPPH